MDFSYIYPLLSEAGMAEWAAILPSTIDRNFYQTADGNRPRWLNAYEALPGISPSSYDLNAASVRVGRAQDMDEHNCARLREALRGLCPWRKGPFDIFGIPVDTEWRSDWKWDRIKDHIEPLTGRTVLDIGCGSGYHVWRMAGAGAALALGIDPTLLYVIQFHAIQKYIGLKTACVLPLGIDDLPEGMSALDTVFSMGLLYHRRAPFEHLLQLKSLLRPGGELVLETLVIEGEMGDVLSPVERYAKMPNVWFIPSVPTLESWVRRMGFADVRTVDVNQTTLEEQHSTDWMRFHSLETFLDPANRNKTVEGYPAPRRAVVIARNANRLAS